MRQDVILRSLIAQLSQPYVAMDHNNAFISHIFVEIGNRSIAGLT